MARTSNRQPRTRRADRQTAAEAFEAHNRRVAKLGDSIAASGGAASKPEPKPKPKTGRICEGPFCDVVLDARYRIDRKYHAAKCRAQARYRSKLAKADPDAAAAYRPRTGKQSDWEKRTLRKSRYHADVAAGKVQLVRTGNITDAEREDRNRKAAAAKSARRTASLQRAMRVVMARNFDIEYESDAKVRKFLKSERVPPVTPESKTWGNRTIDIVRRSLIQHGYEPDPLFLEDRNAYYWRQCRVACISALGGPDRIKFDSPLELSLLPEKKQRRFIKAVKDNPPRENLGDELAPWFLEAVYWTVYRDATGFEADLDEQIENHRPKRSRVQSGRRGPRADQSIGYDYGGRW